MSNRFQSVIEAVLRRRTVRPSRVPVGVAVAYESLEGRRLLAASPAGQVYSDNATSVLRVGANGRTVPRPAGGMLKVADDGATPVTPTPGSIILPGYQIEIRFPDNTLTASQKAVFTTAAARWQQVILGDQPNVSGDFFGTGTETIDDLVIEATGPAIDGPGNILGSASPTYIRNSNQLPLTGQMRFDSADLASLEANGQLSTVILHEMGHVLGLGTLWSTKGLITGSGGTDPRFTGPQAVAQYQAIFGVGTSSVPVENTGGTGTRDGHWRESGGAGVAFGAELMTGFLNSGVANPLSRVTIGQFADLGYTSVNANAFDVYTPPNGGNAYPVIASLTPSPSPVAPGGTFALTANGTTDSNGSVASVRFYRETNGVAGLQVFAGVTGDVAADAFVAADTVAGDGFAASVSTSGLANGTYTYYAQATDNQNLVGVSRAATVTIAVPVVSGVPGVPDLAAVTDTGTFPADDITNRDNGTAAKSLQFVVGNTVSGATVSLYSNGTLIGTAVASGTTTTVTTNGSVDLADGVRGITARQTEPGKTESADSAVLNVTIDTVAPQFTAAPTLSYQTNKPRIALSASEPLSSFVAASLAVTRTSPSPAAVAYNVTGTAAGARLDFLSSPNGILPDGRYTVGATADSLYDVAGNGVSNATTLDFFVLAGDANHDGVVSFADFTALQANFGQPVLDFSRGDFDYNGVIDFADFTVLQSNFGVSV